MLSLNLEIFGRVEFLYVLLEILQTNQEEWRSLQ